MRFQPKAAKTVALAIHVLATNAIKHGAVAVCSTGRGWLAVKWQIVNDEAEEAVRRLTFTWVVTRYRLRSRYRAGAASARNCWSGRRKTS